VVDEVLVDFTQWKLGRSRVQLKELLDGSPGLIRDFQYCLECGRLICLNLNLDLQLAATVENLLQKKISKLDIAFPTPVHEGPEPHPVEAPVPHARAHGVFERNNLPVFQPPDFRWL